jgi:hypothetical protein
MSEHVVREEPLCTAKIVETEKKEGKVENVKT